MALTPEEQAQLQELEKEFNPPKSGESTFSAALKTIAAPATAIPARINDIQRALGGEGIQNVIDSPSQTPNPLNAIPGFAQGFLGGYYPYTVGAFQSAGDLLLGNPTDYTQNVQNAQAQLDQAQADNPYGFQGANILGTLMNPASLASGGLPGGPILKSGLASILQGQYQQPLDASLGDRTANAIESGAVGSAIPFLAGLPKSLANTVFGSPKAAQYLGENTSGSLSAEGLRGQVRGGQSKIYEKIQNELSKYPGDIDVSGAVTPKSIFDLALRRSAQNYPQEHVDDLVKLASELESKGGSASPETVQGLKSLYNKIAKYNKQGVASSAHKSESSDMIADLLREKLYDKVPVGGLNSIYGTGEGIKNVLDDVINKPAAKSGISSVVSNILAKNGLIPAASLTNNQFTSPLLNLLRTPAVVGALVKKVSE